MRLQKVAALLLVAILAAPLAFAATGTHFERHIKRVAASPTPVAVVTLLGDHETYRVDVPEQTVVLVEARSGEAAPFHLRFATWDAPLPPSFVPSHHQTVELPGPASWRLVVDPAAGAQVRIHVTLRGFASAVDGGPAPFTLTDVPAERTCLLPGACLP